jgi:tRNA (cmo5U34)-methyltransferase
MSHFNDPAAVAAYADNARRMVPGLDVLHRLCLQMLSETAPVDARVLVLGAGGGMELAVLAAAQPGWHFAGVDPSAPMLDLARDVLGGHAARVDWVTGTIDAAPPGPFHAAICLLTLHFLPAPDRLATLRGLHARLMPGAPLVVAHHAVPRAGRDRMLARFGEQGAAPGVDRQAARANGQRLGDHLPILDPEEDEDLLRQAGFADIDPFFAALTIRAWVARRV